jgi:multiple antibiotic resistance protein
LAVPLLAGPGAISTAMLLHNTADNMSEQIALILCISAVSLVTYLLLHFSAAGAQWLKPIVRRITTRLMGLLLAAVACQFMINALRDLKLVPAN